MPSLLRLEKLSGLFREEISKIIERDFDFPGETLITITRTEISSDGHYAKILVSLLGKDADKTWGILQRYTPTLQRQLNRRIQIRPVPKIRFEIDKDEFRREQLERTLSRLPPEEKR